MRLCGKNIALSLSVLLFISGAEAQSQDTTRTRVLNAARDIIQNTTTCALITQDQKGVPRVRTMDPFPPESDFTIWLATNPRSRKVSEIRKNSMVTLYYADKNDKGYVTIRGAAQLVDDPNEKAKRWKEAWKAYYPDRNKDYLLIKVVANRIEVINYRKGISGNPLTWEPMGLEMKK